MVHLYINKMTGEILNYDAVLESILNADSSQEKEFNKLVEEIYDNIHKFTRHDLIHAKTLLNQMKLKRIEFSTSPPPQPEALEGDYDQENSMSQEKGYAKTMRPPGAPRRRMQPPSHSIISNINGSAVAVGIMMLNVVVVGLMYIMMVISKIKG